MTAAFDTLVDTLENLREEERNPWLERFSRELEDASSVCHLTDDERALVSEGLADLDSGRVVGDAEMKAFWNRNRRA